MKHARWLAVFAWVQCGLVALTAVGWMWSAALHASSVEAMSDEIVRKFLQKGWCGAVRV